VTDRPRIWLLLGNRRGDNNQVLALGEALGTPFETRTLLSRKTARLRMRLDPNGIRHIREDCLKWLQPPWPDFAIGIGRRSVPVARWIREQSGGRTKLVRIGHPRAPNDLFDLVIATAQYPVPPAENVIRLPLAMNRFRNPPSPTADEHAWLDRWPRPHLLLSLGGTAPMWRLDLAALHLTVVKLVRHVEDAGGTLIVVGSPRTPPAAWQAVRRASLGSSAFATVESSEVRYPVLLNDADEHFVTADSISMISEAVMTRKPVGLIPVEPDSRGRRHLIGRDPETTNIRDPRRFWAIVEELGLVGTVDEPKCGDFDDPVETAVKALRARLGGLFG